MEKLRLKTNDGLKLSALLWDRAGEKSALLLHMMPATKESWEPLAEELYSRGLNVLALDFRGHGESEGAPYEDQSPAEVQKYFLDARAGLNYLEDTYYHTNIVICGASIGANIALQCLAHDHTLKKAAVLSAGLDYYDVKASEFVEELDPSQEVLFVASKDDQSVPSALEMAEQLATKTKSKVSRVTLDTGKANARQSAGFAGLTRAAPSGHGTKMWDEHTELLPKLTSFLSA